jgi:polysaccharide export outer membrane protein
MLERLLASIFLVLSLAANSAWSADMAPGDFKLGPGDGIHIQVYQNPDLTLDARLSESGVISYPLIGSIQLGGSTIAQAEDKIGKALKQGAFVQKPQVIISLLQVRGTQVSILGNISKPGRYPLESPTTSVVDIITMAGGVVAGGADTAILIGMRDGKPVRKEIDIPALFLAPPAGQDFTVACGDVIYINRAPIAYMYGEVQHPGSFRIERNMTVRQALAQSGGPTLRGSESRLRLHRRVNGNVVQSAPDLADIVQPDDVLYIRESLF